ncbi:DUF3080 family protein [Pseudoalteromonas sp.]|uniref:DUF3080 family protein n=1 Tax=Pseudoalteromonas sp. TaxID=53249 RepID=UPI0035632C4E
MLKHLLIILNFVFFLVVVGCSKAPDTLNLDYHSRLQSQLSLPELIPYSDTYKLVKPTFQQIQTSKITILQLAKIQHCQLGQLIAEQNSQLGKMAGPSAQFIYQVRFLQLLPQCIKTLNDEKLIAQLNSVYIEKSSNIFFFWQQLVFLDAQLAALYLPSRYSLMEINEDNKQATLNTLHYLYQIKAALDVKQIEAIPIISLENHLSTLYKNPYLASLLRAMYEQIHILQQQNQALAKISISSLCKAGHNTEKANILSNIFTKFYGSKIQQYHNVLIREYDAIHPQLSSLWQDSFSTPYKSNLLIHPLDLSNSLKALSIKHVTWWQTLYKHCDIVPGR